MYKVDRKQFISWTNGELINIRNGMGIVVNEKECEEAEKRLRNGEEIYLAVDGRVVSKMYHDKLENVYKEELVTSV